MKQVVGQKKHKTIEQISGKKYQICYMNGTRLGHHIAECWIDELNADLVNIEVKHVWPYIRHGQKHNMPPPE